MMEKAKDQILGPLYRIAQASLGQMWVYVPKERPPHQPDLLPSEDSRKTGRQAYWRSAVSGNSEGYWAKIVD